MKTINTKEAVLMKTKADSKQEQREQKIAFILNMAKRRIVSVGYKNVTVDDICSDCGISKKTFYILFHSKEELYGALIGREFDQEVAYLNKQLLNKSMTPIEEITAFIEVVVEFLLKDIFNISDTLEEVDVSSQRIIEYYNTIIESKCIEIMRKLLLEGQKKGCFLNVKDTYITAYACTKLFTSFTYLRTIPFDKGKEREGYYTDVLIQMIIHLINS